MSSIPCYVVFYFNSAENNCLMFCTGRLLKLISYIQAKASIEDGRMDIALPQLLRQRIKLHSFLVRPRRNHKMWLRKLCGHLFFQLRMLRYIKVKLIGECYLCFYLFGVLEMVVILLEKLKSSNLIIGFHFNLG